MARKRSWNTRFRPFWVVEAVYPLKKNDLARSTRSIERAGGARNWLGAGVFLPKGIRDVSFSYIQKAAAERCAARLRRLKSVVGLKVSMKFVGE